MVQHVLPCWKVYTPVEREFVWSRFGMWKYRH